MPSDSNGVYSLPSGYLAITGETIQASQHNPPLEDLASAMTQRLMRSGAAPMTGPLKAVAGSAGSPGVQVGDGAGVYKTTNGFGISVDGVKVAEFILGGLVSGAHWLGELIPYTGLTAPALTVLPYGQTLSRSTYADLWTFAQVEIAAGNTFYNNGNGSTTFGIGDLRGRAPVGKDNMGGSAAGRATSAGGGVDGLTLGAAGGAQSVTLATANLPPYVPAGSVAVSLSVTQPSAYFGPVGTDGIGKAGFLANSSGASGTANPGSVSGIDVSVQSSSFTGFAQGGTSTPFSNMQPSMVCNFLLFAGA